MRRRDFVKGAVATIPANVALQMLTAKFAWAQSSDFDSDVDILNYALTLEYLEAEFYRQGNDAGLLDGREAEILSKLESDEAAHVELVAATVRDIGGTPVDAPEVDFGQAFASRESYLETSFTFENVGTRAYLGAAGFIESKDILQAAAGIFGVECRHAALVANLLDKPAEGGVYRFGAFEESLTRSEVLDLVAPFVPGITL